MEVSSSLWGASIIIHTCDPSVNIGTEVVWQLSRWRCPVFRRECRCVRVNMAPGIVHRVRCVRVTCRCSAAVHRACRSGRFVTRVSCRCPVAVHRARRSGLLVTWVPVRGVRVGHVCRRVHGAIVLTPICRVRDLSHWACNAALITRHITIMPMARTARRVTDLLAGSGSHAFYIGWIP